MKKFIALCFVLFSLAGYANDGKSTLKGNVSDENGLPLPGATVYIESISAGTTTDFDGNFTMLGLSAGTYEVKVLYLGYKTITKEVELADNQTVDVKFKLTPETNALQEIIIKSSARESQARALNKQKNNDNITNVVAADQMGKFPDSNIGDALKRIPGISMQNDQGEARDIIVRGLAPQLNSVTLNGERIPSAEGDNRRVQMDLIPTDMIQVVEVNKAVTPDMEADAIGGSVNLVTRAAAAKLRLSATAAYGRNPVRSAPLYNFSATAGNRFANDKLGFVVSGSVNSNEYGSDNVEFEWKSPTEIKEHDIRRYDVKRIRQSISANLDYKLNENNTIYFKSIYSKRDDQENRYRTRYKFKKGIYKITRQTKGGIDNKSNKNTRLERQKTYKFALGGEHILFNTLELDWKLNTSKASEERPDERYITYEYEEGAEGEAAIVQRNLNTKYPYFDSGNNADENLSNFKLDEVSGENKNTDEKNVGFKLNLKMPLNSVGKFKNSIKVGYKYKDKSKQRNNDFYEYTDNFESQYEIMSSARTSDQSIKDFLAGSQYQSGFFVTNSFLGGLNFTNGERKFDEFLADNYKADENVHAAYAMLKQKLGDKFSAIVGFRLENTKVDYQGYDFDAETIEDISQATITKGNKSYTNFLPNVQLKFNPSNNTVLRFAYTNTIARPNYYDLVPYVSRNSDDLEVEFGNPDLKAATAMNLDVMAERYFSNVGILSGGVFYKNINDFIYEARNKENLNFGGGVEEYETTRIFNGGNAKVYGFELAFQRQLNFLPGILKNLNLYANYTYTDSKTEGIGGRKDGLAFAGAVKNMLNTSLSYETKKLTLRTSLNYADDYIDEYGDEAFEDRYYDSQLFLDFNGSYGINKNFRVFAEVKNITNQPLRFYQGTKNQTMQVEYYNLNWNVGVKYNF